MGFSKQESWSELPCPSAWDLPDPGIALVSLVAPVTRGQILYWCATIKALHLEGYAMYLKS